MPAWAITLWWLLYHWSCMLLETGIKTDNTAHTHTHVCIHYNFWWGIMKMRMLMMRPAAGASLFVIKLLGLQLLLKLRGQTRRRKVVKPVKFSSVPTTVCVYVCTFKSTTDRRHAFRIIELRAKNSKKNHQTLQVRRKVRNIMQCGVGCEICPLIPWFFA